MTLTHSDTITKLMGAMLKVQGAVEGVEKKGKNPHFGKTYATLISVVSAIRPECQANGLVVMQAPGEYANGSISVETIIVHAESGEWIRSSVSLPVVGSDPQKAGSALTYAERYSLMALFNLPPVDDDGNAAARQEPPRQQTQIVGVGGGVPNAGEVVNAMKERINMATTVKALEATKTHDGFKHDYKHLTQAGKDAVQEAYEAKKAELSNTLMAG